MPGFGLYHLEFGLRQSRFEKALDRRLAPWRATPLSSPSA